MLCHLQICHADAVQDCGYLIDTIVNVNDCLSKLQTIEAFSRTQTIYFACKALNYRFDKDKWDGPRPLAVYVNWFIQDQKLNAQLVFEKPLTHDGNEKGVELRTLLTQLKIKKFDDLKNLLAPGVKFYE